ncbi:MAG: DUF3990 domain-containing protein [Lachnospiraceae bacterium]|nr:DUF3990 domain-containing protein [Lachnospiraceae bacterium]
MKHMKLYHGSHMCVERPEILTNGHYKDFGYGFYCTSLERQARRWALAKKKNHVVNIYDYTENNDLEIIQFSEMTEKWLDFIVDCRRGIEHSFDIVEGPMADDTIWDYIEDFMNGNISREAFWVLVKFKYPTHQIVFCTKKALQTLTYERSYLL